MKSEYNTTTTNIWFVFDWELTYNEEENNHYFFINYYSGEIALLLPCLHCIHCCHLLNAYKQEMSWHRARKLNRSPSLPGKLSCSAKVNNRLIMDWYKNCVNKITQGICPGYDIKLIRCSPQYDVKLIWRHRGNDIVSVAAICASAQLIFLFGLTQLAV